MIFETLWVLLIAFEILGSSGEIPDILKIWNFDEKTGTVMIIILMAVFDFTISLDCN